MAYTVHFFMVILRVTTLTTYQFTAWTTPVRHQFVLSFPELVPPFPLGILHVENPTIISLLLRAKRREFSGMIHESSHS